MPVQPNTLPDHCSQGGTAALAQRIEKYWTARGETVHARVERVSDGTQGANGAFFAVRSDLTLMIPQLPQRAPLPKARALTKGVAGASSGQLSSR